MPLVLTQKFVLVQGAAATDLTADHPVIGWRTIVTPANIAATTAHGNFPASNMANPATHLFWRGTAAGATEYITIVPDELAERFDYVGIARHNLGSQGIAVSIGYADPGWIELTPPVVLEDDRPAMFRFPARFLPNLKIRLTVGAVVPQISVVYAGKLLTLPRKIYQGFAPINHARVAKVTNGRSEAGQFLGRIVLQEFAKDTVPLSLISPAYFREHIAAFLIDSKENPFFFAWRPQTYPNEIGFCHMTNDPVPVNEAPHGLVAMSLEMTGVI